MAAIKLGEARGTQIRPFDPSAIVPSAARKLSKAFRLWRDMECDHAERVRRISFRLIGCSAARRMARTYSMDSRVGLAPGRAYSGEGTRRVALIQYMYT